MENYIIIAIVAVIVGLAAFYIYRAKKSGQKCVGCPYAKSCGSKSCCCSSSDKMKK
jgi:hypothetical protein